MSSLRIAVVTPIYEDREASSRLFEHLAAEFGDAVYVIAVDDGSVREPVEPASLRRAGLRGMVVRLRRNVGHQRAIAVGIGYVADRIADFDCVVVMDSDGEDVPATIPALIDALRSEDHDVAVAVRKSRVETLRFKAFYLVYKIIFGVLTGRRISFGNFIAMKPLAAKRLAAMQEVWTHVAGAVLGSKLRMAYCPLDRGARYAGRSKMNFVGLILHGFKALMVFAEDVLVRVGLACVLVSALSILAAAIATLLKIVGFATPGWFSVALGVLFLVFLQTATLTLMTLMLSGVAKAGVSSGNSYKEFVDELLPAEP
jgi:polyisoprenyl-phosphate glycosyltransferase